MHSINNNVQLMRFKCCCVHGLASVLINCDFLHVNLPIVTSLYRRNILKVKLNNNIIH